LAICEVGELPSDGELIKLSPWSKRKKNNKANKWEGGMLVFQEVEVFKEVRLDFCLQRRYRKICCAMYLERQKLSLGVGFEG
jgi:hypothetical protein